MFGFGVLVLGAVRILGFGLWVGDLIFGTWDLEFGIAGLHFFRVEG